MGAKVSQIRVPINTSKVKDNVVAGTGMIPDVSNIVAVYAENPLIQYICDKWNKTFSIKKDTLPALDLSNYKGISLREFFDTVNYINHEYADSNAPIIILEPTHDRPNFIIRFNVNLEVHSSDSSEDEDESKELTYALLERADKTILLQRVDKNSYLPLNRKTFKSKNIITFFDSIISRLIKKNIIKSNHYFFDLCEIKLNYASASKSKSKTKSKCGLLCGSKGTPDSDDERVSVSAAAATPDIDTSTLPTLSVSPEGLKIGDRVIIISNNKVGTITDIELDLYNRILYKLEMDDNFGSYYVRTGSLRKISNPTEEDEEMRAAIELSLRQSRDSSSAASSDNLKKDDKVRVIGERNIGTILNKIDTEDGIFFSVEFTGTNAAWTQKLRAEQLEKIEVVENPDNLAAAASKHGGYYPIYFHHCY
jgi:hypothetical protein